MRVLQAAEVRSRPYGMPRCAPKPSAASQACLRRDLLSPRAHQLGEVTVTVYNIAQTCPSNPLEPVFF